MAESHSEMSSEQIEQLVENLNWMIAINSVLLQEAGGVVEIKREVLQGINLNSAKANVSYDEDREVFIIEGVFEDGTE